MTTYAGTITATLGAEIVPGAFVSIGLVGKETTDRPWRPVAGYLTDATEVGGYRSHEVPASGTLVVDFYANTDITPANTGWDIRVGGINKRSVGVYEMTDLSVLELIDTPASLASIVVGEGGDGIDVTGREVSVDTSVIRGTDGPEILDTRRSLWVPGSRMIASSGSPTQTTDQTWLMPPGAASQVSAQVSMPGPIDVRAVYRALGNPHGPNLLTVNQQGVETNTTGFTNGTGTTIARTTAQFRTGTASLSFMRNSGAGTGTARATTLTGLNGTAVTVGVTYVGQCWVLAATAGTATMRMFFYDAAGTQIGSPTSGTAKAVTTTAWSAASVIVTAPTGAAFAAIDVTSSAIAASEMWFADDWALAEANQPVQCVFRPLHRSWAEGSTQTTTSNTGTLPLPFLVPTGGSTHHDVVASGLDVDPPQQITLARQPTNADDLFDDGAIELVGLSVGPARARPLIADPTRYLGLAGGILGLPDGRVLVVTREGQGHSWEGPIVAAFANADLTTCDWDNRWEIADAAESDPDPDVTAFRGGTALMMDDDRVAVLVIRSDDNHSTYGMGLLFCDDWANVDDPDAWSYAVIEEPDPGHHLRMWFELHRLGEPGDGRWIAFGQDRDTGDLSVMTTETNGGTDGSDWTITHGVVPAEVMDPDFIVTQDSPSEFAMTRIAGTDRFVGVGRRNFVNTQSAIGLATDDPTDPASWRVQDTVTPMGQQPCAVWQDPVTGLLHWWVFQRGAASIQCNSNGISERTGTPDDVWANPGTGWSTRWRRLYVATGDMLGYYGGIYRDRLGQMWCTFSDNEFPDADPPTAQLSVIKMWPWDD